MSHVPKRSHLCVCCSKTFETTTGFVSHCEASERCGKCRIAQASDYRKLLAEATAGLIMVRSRRDVKIWGQNDEESRGIAKGVLETKYEARDLPEEFRKLNM